MPEHAGSPEGMHCMPRSGKSGTANQGCGPGTLMDNTVREDNTDIHSTGTSIISRKPVLQLHKRHPYTMKPTNAKCRPTTDLPLFSFGRTISQAPQSSRWVRIWPSSCLCEAAFSSPAYTSDPFKLCSVFRVWTTITAQISAAEHVLIQAYVRRDG